MALARGAIVIEIPVNGTASVYFKEKEGSSGTAESPTSSAGAAEKPASSSAE
jgi:hypothetical protein